MPEWNDILDQYGQSVWQTLHRVLPGDAAAGAFTNAMLAAHRDAQRDSVSDWRLFLEHVATVTALETLRQLPAPGGTSLADRLRARLREVPSEQSATIFCLRYLSGMTFAEIAMETRATLDSIGPTANEMCSKLGRELAQVSSSDQDATLLADDLLESAVAEMRSAVVPPLSQELIEKTRKALAEAPLIDFEKPPQPSRNLPLALAALLIMAISLGVLAYFKYRKLPPDMEFAEMVQAIAEENSASYYMVRNVILSDDRTRKVQAQVSVLEPGRIRQVMDPPDTTIIWDARERKALTLEQNKGKATLRNWEDMFAETYPVDAVELLKKLKPDDGTPARQTTVRGRRVQEFVVQRDDLQMSIWADAETKLPAIVELQLPQGNPPGSVLMNEFTWGQPLDEAQFAMEAPEGYELASIRVNLKPASEQDLVKALGIAAQLNGGKFPAQFDRVGMNQLIADLYKKLPPRGTPEHRDALEQLEANLMQLGRGWMFIAEPENGSDWHYAGSDVLYGSDRPIFWYRPSGANVYHVIDAQLVVRPALPDRLPSVPSTRLSGGTTRPTGLAPQPSLPTR